MDSQFSVLAQYYDKLNYNADYKKVADYIEGVFALYDKKPELVLDLACGTGSLTLELARRGYDMTGLDLSPDMLNIASLKKNHGKNILWLNQDMCAFELYGTVDAAVCCFDSINYILDENKIAECFRLVYNYLNPGGVFIFDVNSRHKFEKIYAKNDIILEKNGILCAWRNNYNKKSRICEFYISLFIDQRDAGYKRLDEVQREKYHSEDLLASLLELAGFSGLRICYDFDTDKTKEKNIKNEFERICFSCIKKI
jgi:SAM-dependent methyltransferase